MKLWKQASVVLLVIASVVLLFGCSNGGDSTGVCTGFSSSLNKTYCYEGWDKSECEEWDSLQVNGADWYFYKGQTCADRGLGVGSN
jgi:hypothetical protein